MPEARASTVEELKEGVDDFLHLRFLEPLGHVGARVQFVHERPWYLVALGEQPAQPGRLDRAPAAHPVVARR